MLYDEFLKGVPCRENQCNYNVYKRFEQVYMEFDFSKQEIYRMASTFVDNELSLSEKARIENLEESIKRDKEELKERKRRIKEHDYYGSYDSVNNQLKDDKKMLIILKETIEQAQKAIEFIKAF